MVAGSCWMHHGMMVTWHVVQAATGREEKFCLESGMRKGVGSGRGSRGMAGPSCGCQPF